MQSKIRWAILATAVAVTWLSGFGLDTLGPRPLHAQKCGAYDGKLCASDCGRECSNGSCCGWLYYYYKEVPQEVQ